MKTKYVEDECCYLLSNFGTALCPIFIDQEDCEDFKKRVQKHLSPICRILSYGFSNNEFRLVVNLRSRTKFEDFYLQKKKASKAIPESTYILSQEMANIQSGYAKRFNQKYDRKGALFARRFSKWAILNEHDLLEVVKRVNSLYTIESYSLKWQYKISAMRHFGKIREIRDRGVITKIRETRKWVSPLLNAKNFLLQGSFKTPTLTLKI